MKRLVRMWLVFFFVGWVLYMGVEIFVDMRHGHDINFVTKGIKCAIFSIILASAPLLGVYSIFPRSKYLESNDTAKPTFKVACSSVIDVPEDFDFSRLKTEIAAKWLITLSDDISHVLKFRVKWHIFKSWGAAAWLKLDNDTRKIQIECFPLAGIQDNDLARKMQKEIKKMLET